MRKIPTDIIVDDKILSEAAEYYLKLQENSISGAELKAWQAWFMRSEAHQQAFRRLENLCGMLDMLPPESFASDTEDQTPEADTETALNKRKGGSVISLVTADLPERPTLHRPFLKMASLAATVAALIVAGFMVMPVLDRGVILDKTPVYATATGETRIVTLPDGSIVELAPASQVTVAYTKNERRLSLDDGQAIFTVSKNPLRPFVVAAGTGTVTAIGTVFNVSRRAGDVQVRVLEGTVAVRPVVAETGSSIAQHISAPIIPVALVTAGRQTEYSEGGIIHAVQEADVRSGLGWRTGVLTMVNRPLASVIQELNRYLENEIAIGDDAVGNFSFTGTVYPDQVNEWLDGLKAGYPIRVVRVGSSTVLMLDSKPTSAFSS